MGQRKIGGSASREISPGMTSIKQYRLVKPYGTTPGTIEYNGDGEENAIGVTQMEYKAEDVEAGFSGVEVQDLTPGQELYLEISEAIAINQPFTGATDGKIKNILTNDPAERQFGYGKTLEAGDADTDVILCRIDPGFKYTK